MRHLYIHLLSLNLIQDFLKVSFPPEYPGSLPSYIFYDNNCKLREHLVASGDTYFLGKVGLVVDVFHFKSKHKKTDLNCQTHCNPANFPELITSDGEWRFNSSAAEQTNAWIVGFEAILREMTLERYNFVLDEVISVRNDFVIGELRKKGYKPHLVPISTLKGL